MFYPTSQFPFTVELERNWRQIYGEYLAIRHDLIDWFEKKLYDQGWKVFGLFDFPGGAAISANTQRCPVTTALVQNFIGNHGAVGFSVLMPQTKIKPHQGYAGAFLRCHLGLQIPEGNCALKVENEVRKWQNGQCLIFDDRLEHEAWNLTNEARVVLLLDFVPPKTTDILG